MTDHVKKLNESLHQLNRNEELNGILDDIQVTKEITPDMVIVTTRVEDWKEEMNNLVKNPDLKSYAREGCICDVCKKPVVISDLAWKSKPAPNKIVCVQCVLEIIEKM